MKTKNRILAALLCSIGAVFASVDARAAQFTSVCSFGDSLSDAGYFRQFLRSIGIPEAVVTQLGSFTTNPDPVFTELIAQYYGITPAPSNVTGGCIYAQGGARVALDSAATPPGSPQRSVTTQISEYLATRSGAADPNGLYTVFVGANDFLQNRDAFLAGTITQAQFQSNFLAAATAEVQQIARLRAAGAQYVVVVGAPDFGITPAAIAGGPALAGAATQLAGGYNLTLWTGLASAGVRVIPIDLFTFLNEVRANAAAFGFTNTTGVACGVSPLTGSTSSQFCLPGNFTAANANNTFLFADSTGHPTGATQAILAQFVESMIEGPYQYSQLTEAPLRSRALHVQGIADGVLTGHMAEPGKLTFFASGGAGDFDVAAGIGNVGIAHNNEAYTLGVTMRASESVVLGVAYGQTRSRGRFGSSAGDFHARDHNYSFFGSLKAGRFYATGIATMSEIDFNDLHRNIQLGPVLRTATASTSGSNASVFLNAGYDFALGRFLVGPTVGATWQDVEVAGFDEAGAASNNLRVFTQKRRSQVWSAGVRASMDFDGWTPWIRLTADKEREDNARVVTAMPLSMVGFNLNYDVPAYVGDSTYTTFAAGIRGLLTRNVGVGVSFYKVSGRSGIEEQGATATLSVKF